VAGRLIGAHGIDGVTLSDIAEAADVSRGNLYSHFGSKQELLDAICEPMFTYAAEQLGAIETLPPSQAIESLLRVHARIWRELPGALSVAHQLHDLLAEEAGSTSAISSRHVPDGLSAMHRPHNTPGGEPTSAHSAGPKTILRIFDQAAEEGILRFEPALAVKVFNSVTVPLLELCQETPHPDDAFVESMIRLLLI
jgi:AcrR family transcriptional regulator